MKWFGNIIQLHLQWNCIFCMSSSYCAGKQRKEVCSLSWSNFPLGFSLEKSSYLDSCFPYRSGS